MIPSSRSLFIPSVARQSIAACAVAAIALSAGADPARADSYREVRGRVFAHPLNGNEVLPTYRGVKPGQVLGALLGFTNALIQRLRGTTTRPEDFKSDRPKLLHPMGTCAEARWSVTEASTATGLFEKGTEVPAIVRISAGTPQIAHEPGKARLLGMAIKLFPSQDEGEPVITRNIFLMDQHGLDGGDGPSFFRAFPGYEAPYYQNVARGHGALVKVVGRIFRRFDSNPDMRPLEPLADVDSRNHAVAAPVAPRLIQLVPALRVPESERTKRWHADLRREVLAYAPGEIAFSIFIDGKPIGSLTLGTAVVSDVCDRELHFHHHPTPRNDNLSQ